MFSDSGLLKKANLVRPVLMEVCELLAVRGIIAANKTVKSISELKEMFL